MGILDVTDYTIKQIIFSNWMETSPSANISSPPKHSLALSFRPLLPLRNWINQIEITDPQKAHRICDLIPSQCPFSRTITLFGRTLITIPPLCKLNPLYEELINLRFRALCYLADECGEDISTYC
jgi:hypothetical protein